MDRLRGRIGDKHVLALVKAFLKAGILGQDGALRDNNTGTPQGGILSPVLANVALSVLDEFVAQTPGGTNSTPSQRATRRRKGQANYRLVRYADDWLLLVSGTREHAEDMRTRVATVLAPMGLRLSEEKTKITHIDEGLDFIGWRIQRHRKRGTNRYYVYTYPSRKALKAVTIKVKIICRQNVNQPMPAVMRKLNPALRGWCAYFRPGVSSATFAYLARYTWDRVLRWARRKHRRITVKAIRHRYCNGGWWPTTPDIGLFNPAMVRTTRYRYRGTAIPTPWPTTG
jgi:RNA-directed DNA polymerase